MQLTILVGTMTGSSQFVADELEVALGKVGVEVEVKPMDGLDAGVFSSGGLFLVCMSTYGRGDVPDNAKPLFAQLQSERPDLSAVRYGMVALGDSTYADTFCGGGKRFDELLTGLGAKRLGDTLLHDASGGTLPEDAAVEWALPWIDACRKAPNVTA